MPVLFVPRITVCGALKIPVPGPDDRDRSQPGWLAFTVCSGQAKLTNHAIDDEACCVYVSQKKPLRRRTVDDAVMAPISYFAIRHRL
jgi:hypothetical protein